MANVSSIPIIDLHCDLLAFLGDGADHDPEDAASRCSLPQLRAGGVILQVMAIYAATDPASAETGARQVACFVRLRHRLTQSKSPLRVVAAIENAACLGSASDSAPDLLVRLGRMHRDTGGLLSASLTWNDENRFGGGSATSVGLKDDGRRLMSELAKLGIALDLAHASEELAEDCLTFIDRERLPVAVLASHANFRSVFDHPRNLSDEIAREIIRRRGIIGLNAIRRFLGGTDSTILSRHVAHGIHLGAARALAFGADFCADHEVPPESDGLVPRDGRYWQFWSDASAYGSALSALERTGLFPVEVMAALAHGNAAAWLERLGRSDLTSAAPSPLPSP